ncbi:hypothetical protein [Corticicoccus populi]|uniref:PepSY domain-containing protein n=1 Tax=Corticicoccus populi TaxID=1812821 RepID=A0ABW5WXU9_9STAP
MKRTVKILIALLAVGIGILIGITIVTSVGSEYMDEAEARSMVEERYQGEITEVSLSENEEMYTVTLEDGAKLYTIILDRENYSVSEMSETDNPNAEEQEKKEGESSGGNDSSENETSSLITDEEARSIASEEVGGEFLQSALNDTANPEEYLVMHLVDDDDEAAIVSLNARTGEINRVIWLEIDLNEIGDLGAFIKEVAEYNAENPYYYSEFDYEDGEYEEYDN